MTEEFEFSQDFVKPQAHRRQLLRTLVADSVTTSRQIVPGGGIEQLALITLPITHIIYNADNVRIRDKVLTEFEIENTDTEKFDQHFYSKRENFETQKFIHSVLSELAHATDADIYTRLKQTQVQRDPILIDTDGVIVDGNRRMSSIRELYTENPADFPEFNEIECVVIPRADRQNNKEFEHQIHFADTLQLEYTWLNKALEAQRLEAERKDRDEIRRQLQLSSLTAVDKLLITAKGMQRYNKVKAGFDPEHINNNYVDLGQYGNEQSFIEIGKVMDRDIPASDKKQQTLLQSVIHFVVQNDRKAIGGRAFNMNQANRAHKLFDWYKRAIGVENTSRANQKLRDFGTSVVFDDLRGTIQEMNRKRLQDERQQTEDEQQSQTKSKIEDALDALETINVNSGTTRKTHLRNIKRNLDKIDKETKRVREDIGSQEENLS